MWLHHGQISHFGATDAGDVEEFQDVAITTSKGAFQIRQAHQAYDFLATERFGQTAGLLTGKIKIRRWVGLDDAFPMVSQEQENRD